MDVSLRVYEQWVTKSSFKKTWKQKKKLSKLTLNFWAHICFFYRYSVIWSESLLVHVTQLASKHNCFSLIFWLLSLRNILWNSFGRFMKSNTLKIIQKLFLKLTFLLYKYFHLTFSLKYHNRSEVPTPCGSLVYYLIIANNCSNFSFIIFLTHL